MFTSTVSGCWQIIRQKSHGQSRKSRSSCVYTVSLEWEVSIFPIFLVKRWPAGCEARRGNTIHNRFPCGFKATLGDFTQNWLVLTNPSLNFNQTPEGKRQEVWRWCVKVSHCWVRPKMFWWGKTSVHTRFSRLAWLHHGSATWKRPDNNVFNWNLA